MLGSEHEEHKEGCERRKRCRDQVEAVGMPSWHSRSQSRSSLDPARGTTGERQSGPGEPNLPVYHVSACKPADRADDTREMNECLFERAPQPPVVTSPRAPATRKPAAAHQQATVTSSAADTSAPVQPAAAALQSYSTGIPAATTSPHVSKGDPLTDFVRASGAAVNNVVQVVSDALCVPSCRFLRRKWAKQAKTRRTRRVMALIARHT